MFKVNGGLVIAANSSLAEQIQRVLNGTAFRIKDFSSELIDEIYREPPSVMIVEYSDEAMEFLKTLRSDPIFNLIPLIMVFPQGTDIKNWGRLPVDDFIFYPFDPREMQLRYSLALARAQRTLELNPLTMLPGNARIFKEVQRRLDQAEEFGICYADIDNFKPYNDVYGFSRGDEVIKMTARLITNVVKVYDYRRCFVGHIGGDDFIFVVSPEVIEKVCQEIVDNFDELIRAFYTKEDLQQQFLIAEDRLGNQRKFPLMSISIGVTINRGWFSHYGRVAQVVTEIKEYAKRQPGSCYFIDRRTYEDEQQ